MNRGLLNELRNSLADVTAREKAYNVPALCVRLGLEAGNESEAMRSKFRYASARLASVPGDGLIAIARLLLEEEHDFGLAELLAKVSEAGTPPVTELTRRRLIAGFDGEPLCTEYDEIEFLKTIWPLAAIPFWNGRKSPRPSGSSRPDLVIPSAHVNVRSGQKWSIALVEADDLKSILISVAPTLRGHS